jgi:hypothetical protein
MRSSIPSPLTSPAALTDEPERSLGWFAYQHEAARAVAAAGGVEARERKDGREALRRTENDIARAR